MLNLLVKFVVVLILSVSTVVSVGHASTLTTDKPHRSAFEGAQVFNITSMATTSYNIDSSGNVIVSVATNTNFDRVFFSSTGLENTYQACQANVSQPGHNWSCSISNSEVGDASGIYLVATAQ